MMETPAPSARQWALTAKNVHLLHVLLKRRSTMVMKHWRFAQGNDPSRTARISERDTGS
jgi:hypothetical protein